MNESKNREYKESLQAVFMKRMQEEGYNVNEQNVNCFSEREIYAYLDNMGWSKK